MKNKIHIRERIKQCNKFSWSQNYKKQHKVQRIHETQVFKENTKYNTIYTENKHTYSQAFHKDTKNISDK